MRLDPFLCFVFYFSSCFDLMSPLRFILSVLSGLICKTISQFV